MSADDVCQSASGTGSFDRGIGKSGYDRQEADACITISQRLSVKGGSPSIWSPTKNKNSLWNKGKLKTHFEKHGIFVGTASGGKIKTYYKWDGRTDDAVINYLKEIGLWN